MWVWVNKQFVPHMYKFLGFRFLSLGHFKNKRNQDIYLADAIVNSQVH